MEARQGGGWAAGEGRGKTVNAVAVKRLRLGIEGAEPE